MNTLYTTVIILTGVAVVTAMWTFIDRRFPSSRLPFIYREELWQNILVNFILATIIVGLLLWYFL